MDYSFPLWLPLVFCNNFTVNGRRVSMTMRGYEGGAIWHWIVTVDDGYMGSGAESGIAMSSTEAKDAAEASAEELLCL